MELDIFFYLPIVGLMMAFMLYGKSDIEENQGWKKIAIILIILNTILFLIQLIKHGFIL